MGRRCLFSFVFKLRSGLLCRRTFPRVPMQNGGMDLLLILWVFLMNLMIICLFYEPYCVWQMWHFRSGCAATFLESWLLYSSDERWRRSLLTLTSVFLYKQIHFKLCKIQDTQISVFRNEKMWANCLKTRGRNFCPREKPTNSLPSFCLFCLEVKPYSPYSVLYHNFRAKSQTRSIWVPAGTVMMYESYLKVIKSCHALIFLRTIRSGPDLFSKRLILLKYESKYLC